MPLAIDLYCGLGGWTDGFLAEGYDVIGFDIEEHAYGEHRYPAQLVVQDVCTLHGSQFKAAAVIVASPPCQEYSYMAMPWKLAKAKAAAIRADTTGEKLGALNRLFDACFRIQREACFAAGRYIPLVVENVRGAQPWVGRARWNFGSFYLWGDVPALMPPAFKAIKVPSFRFDGTGRSFQTAADRRTDPGKGARFTSRDCGIEASGLKRPGIKLSEVGFNVSMAREVAADLKGAKYERSAEDKRRHIGINRKAASAMIAKIPLPLSRHIAVTFGPPKNMTTPATPRTENCKTWAALRNGGGFLSVRGV
jgi:C-5 cytosine-specific DNA methylase